MRTKVRLENFQSATEAAACSAMNKYGHKKIAQLQKNLYTSYIQHVLGHHLRFLANIIAIIIQKNKISILCLSTKDKDYIFALPQSHLWVKNRQYENTFKNILMHFSKIYILNSKQKGEANEAIR